MTEEINKKETILITSCILEPTLNTGKFPALLLLTTDFTTYQPLRGSTVFIF